MRNQERFKLALFEEEGANKKKINRGRAANYFRVIMLYIILQGAVTTSFAQDAALIEISGIVTDQNNQAPLADVSVQVKGTVAGTVTNNTGNFVLRAKTKLPFTLLFSSIGFQPQELEVKSVGSNLQVALATQTVLGNEVVVTASRISESILKSPVAVEKLDIRAIRETANTKVVHIT